MLEFHRKMLGDRVRNEAFYAALKSVIKPGESVVVDIGSGTGFLGFLARQLGAKECHLYEVSNALGLSKIIAEKNDITGCRFIHRHSTQVKNPPKADIVVSETLGNYALEEHLLENMEDARERFLKPGGVLIPGRLSQFAAPVVTDRLRKDIDTWEYVGFDLDLSPARAMGFHNAYVKTILPDDLLKWEGAAQRFDTMDFSEGNESRRSCSAQWKIAEDTAIHGFAVWWEAELTPGVTLSTSPFSPPTHWEQIFLPLPEPIVGHAGDALLLSLTSDTRWKSGVNLAWKAQLFRGGKAVASSPLMDMKRGHLG